MPDCTASRLSYEINAISMFVRTRVREEDDRFMVAQYDDTYRIVQDFTDSAPGLLSTLPSIATGGAGACLFDALQSQIHTLQLSARSDHPWVIIALSATRDNRSRCFPAANPLSPEFSGLDIRKHLTRSPIRMPYLIGLGDGPMIDLEALATIGHFGSFPCALFTEEAYPKLPCIFWQIGQQVEDNVKSLKHMWKKMGHDLKDGIDFAFLLETSDFMARPLTRRAPHQPSSFGH